MYGSFKDYNEYYNLCDEEDMMDEERSRNAFLFDTCDSMNEDLEEDPDGYAPPYSGAAGAAGGPAGPAHPGKDGACKTAGTGKGPQQKASVSETAVPAADIQDPAGAPAPPRRSHKKLWIFLAAACAVFVICLIVIAVRDHIEAKEALQILDEFIDERVGYYAGDYEGQTEEEYELQVIIITDKDNIFFDGRYWTAVKKDSLSAFVYLEAQDGSKDTCTMHFTSSETYNYRMCIYVYDYSEENGGGPVYINRTEEEYLQVLNAISSGNAQKADERIASEWKDTWGDYTSSNTAAEEEETIASSGSASSKKTYSGTAVNEYDYDIEEFYSDHEDEYEDYDDAYDAFMSEIDDSEREEYLK